MARRGHRPSLRATITFDPLRNFEGAFVRTRSISQFDSFSNLKH